LGATENTILFAKFGFAIALFVEVMEEFPEYDVFHIDARPSGRGILNARFDA
jgi:hypothetical protein